MADPDDLAVLRAALRQELLRLGDDAEAAALLEPIVGPAGGGAPHVPPLPVAALSPGRSDVGSSSQDPRTVQLGTAKRPSGDSALSVSTAASSPTSGQATPDGRGPARAVLAAAVDGGLQRHPDSAELRRLRHQLHVAVARHYMRARGIPRMLESMAQHVVARRPRDPIADMLSLLESLPPPAAAPTVTPRREPSAQRLSPTLGPAARSTSPPSFGPLLRSPKGSDARPRSWPDPGADLSSSSHSAAGPTEPPPSDGGIGFTFV